VTSRNNRGSQVKLHRPALRGAVVVDTPNGKLRIRKWPAKRGTPKSPKVREQNEWFKKTAKLIKFADAGQYDLAIKATVGTGLYPRDLLMHAVSSGFYDILDTDGQMITNRRKWIEPVNFQGVIAKPPSNFGISTSSLQPIDWDLPLIDTAGMWDPGNPDQFIIPAGVQVVQVTCVLASATTGSKTFMLQIRDPVAAASLALVSADMGTPGYGTHVETGALIVEEGDVIQVRCQSTSIATARADITRLTIAILEAE